jgi:cell division protein FtsW
LQPSEFVKPAFIVFAAWIFSAVKSNNSIQAGLIVTLIWLLIISLLLGQPDVGQAFLITVCFAAVCFFGGISIRGTITFILVIMGLVSLAYLKLNHFRVRIEKFLSPSTSDTYQIDKALEAISNGGFLGRGPGEGAVKYSLPDGHTDYIFAVTVEEFGYLISSFLIILLGSFVLRGFRNAVRLNDYFSQLAVAGLATMIGVQLLINLFVNLNMMPSKGMTLPFISYGGSSMLALCFAAGLILSFTRKRPGAYGYGE